MPVNAQPQEQEKPKLLFFFERTDGYARRVDGYLAQVLQRRHNHDAFRIHRIEVQQRPDLATRFKVEQTPSICVIENHRVALVIHKPRGAKQLAELLAPWLQPSRQGPASSTGRPRDQGRGAR